MHVILIGKILCFVFHFFIVKSTDSSLNLSWLKRPPQGLYFVLSTDVVNNMLISIILVCSSAQQETEKQILYIYYLIYFYFLFGIQSKYRNRVEDQTGQLLLYFTSRYVTSFAETQVLWRGQHGQGKLPALFIRLYTGTHQNSLQTTLVLHEA